MYARPCLTWSLSLAVAVLVWGCTADTVPIGGDGSVPRDSGSGTGDGGIVVDSGSRDSGGSDVDGGATGTDAGGGDVDGGAVGTDAGASATDAGAAGTDAGASATDAGAAGTDAGGGGTDAGGVRSDAGTECAGIACTGFPATFVRGCTNDDSCVGEVHRLDCCGTLRVLGMNHSEASAFCTAEAVCRASYPPPGMCADVDVVADTGSTPRLDNIAARCADIDPTSGVGTCTTFVCGVPGGPACPAARRIGSCASPVP